jgi:hypothetical protein
MENYEILQKNPSSDSQPHLLNEQVLNMVKIMSHDIRGALTSMLATLKLLNRGYYGKMEEAAANRIKDLLSNATSLTAITDFTVPKRRTFLYAGIARLRNGRLYFARSILL